MQIVEFNAGGERLVGQLHLPELRGREGPFPALVFTGPYTGVKEQVTGTYAKLLAKAGFVTLAFDHRNFGESEGKVRQHEEPQKKLDDLAAATSFLQSRPDVSKNGIGAVGICLGASFALTHAAFDPRIKALVTIAGAYLSAIPDNLEATTRKAGWLEGFAKELEMFADGNPTRIKAVSSKPDEPAAMPGAEPYGYYGTARSFSPYWRNEMTRLSSYNLARFDAANSANLLTNKPSITVHGTIDAFCSPDDAKAVFDRIPGRKEFQLIETSNHIDLYDNSPIVAQAVSHVAQWLKNNLA